MSDPRFPAVTLANQRVPYDHPQYMQGDAAPQRQPALYVDRSAPVWNSQSPADGITPGSGAGVMPTTMPAAGDGDAVPVHDAWRVAITTSQALDVSAAASVKLLDQPPHKRNFLMIRNSSAAANVYVEFGHDASADSVLRLKPNDLVLFDTVVPQGDLYALADGANGRLSFSFSTII